MIVIGQGGCIRAKWLYSGKVVVFGQYLYYSGRVVVFGKKWLYSCKVVVFLQSGCNREKVV